MTEEEKVVPLQLLDGHGVTRLVQELHLEYVGGEYLHDRAHVTGQQAAFGPVVEQRDDIERLDGWTGHGCAHST